MNNFPNPKVYSFIFGILILYFSMEFYLQKKKEFNQLNYNWGQVKVVNQYENVVIDSINYNYIAISNLNLDNKYLQKTFLFQTETDKYYFRPSTITKKGKLTEFGHVIWLLDKAPKPDEVGKLIIVDLPLIQTGDIKVNTIGGTFLTYGSAAYFRKYISQLKDVIFVGNNIDLFAFPCDASLYKTSTDIATDIYNTKLANVYILFLGDRDGKLSDKIIIQNWNIILTELQQREKTKNIIVLTLPPSEKENINKYRNHYNGLIYQLKKKHSFELIDTKSILNNKTDLDFLRSYPNKNGYKKIAKAIILFLNE